MRCLLLSVLVACGRDESTPAERDWPSQNGNDAPLPAPSFGDVDGSGNISPLATSFKGTIAELRQAPNVKNGLRVKIPHAVVIAVNGGGDYMTVSDPEVTEFSGLEVQRCLGSDLECKQARPAFGAAYALSGTLGVSFGVLTLTNVKADLLDDAPIDVWAIGVTADEIEKGKTTGNEALHSSYVGVVDAEGQWAELVVHDIEPADELNASFPAELADKCGVANLSKADTPDDVSCCPSGVGPKYGNVHLKEEKTGRIIALGTGNYRDIDFTGWPCSKRDLDKALRPGQRFLMLQGVFAIKRHGNALSPTRLSDYVLQK